MTTIQNADYSNPLSTNRTPWRVNLYLTKEPFDLNCLKEKGKQKLSRQKQ